MSSTTVTPVAGEGEGRSSGFRFPKLLLLFALLFVLDMMLPDFLPFVDEILLGLTTAILACLRERRSTRGAVDGGLTPGTDRPR